MNLLNWGRPCAHESSCFTGNSRKYELAWVAQERGNLCGGESSLESPHPPVIGRSDCQSWTFLRLVGPLSPFSTFERERWKRLVFHAATKLLFFIIQPTTELSWQWAKFPLQYWIENAAFANFVPMQWVTQTGDLVDQYVRSDKRLSNRDAGVEPR